MRAIDRKNENVKGTAVLKLSEVEIVENGSNGLQHDAFVGTKRAMPGAQSPILSCSAAFDLIHQRIGAIHLSQGFHDRAGMHAHGAGLFIGVGEIEHQRLNIAVEDNSHVLAGFVDDRTAAVAAYDVGSAHKIEWRRKIQRLGWLQPALW